MMRSMFSGVSGLRNHQTRMDVIGNNIANVNTIGFKGSRVNFQDILSQNLQGAAAPQGNRGGTNPMQIGLGMSVASIDTIFTDGSTQPTGKQTDLALQGQGFFIVNDGATSYYTRAGNFDFDTNGNYIVPGTGLKVQGWMADNNGKIDAKPSNISNIIIPVGTAMAANPTENITMTKNLNSSTVAGTSYQMSTTVYDSLGAAHIIDINFEKAVVPTVTTSVAITGKNFSADDATPNVQNITVNDASGTARNLTVTMTLNDPSIPSYDYTVTEGSDTWASGTTTAFPLADISVTDGALLSFDLTYPGAATVTAAGAYTDPAPTIAYTPTTVTITGKSFSTDDATSNVQTFTVDDTSGAPRDITVTMTLNDPTIPSYDYSVTEGANTLAFGTTTVFPPANISVTDGSLLSFDLMYPGAVTIDAAGAYTNPAATNTSAANQNAWTWTASTSDTAVTISNGGPHPLTFDGIGEFVGGGDTIALTYTNGAVDQNIAIDLSGLTQYASESTVNGTADGYSSGTLETVTLDTSGVVTGRFSNGLSQALAQVALATFNNPGGLLKAANNCYAASNNSGLAQVGTANSGGRGSISPGSLEMSNVDLSQQFTDMIVTQRGFQANSKIITTSDEMLQDLVNLKR